MKRTLNLFCLPFAGGNKYSYREFKAKAPAFLNIITLEYPGRGARMNEPLSTDITYIVNDLYDQIRTLIDKVDYAFYGHSMGGLVAYLLTIRIIENNHKQPLHLFITGTSGPAAPSRGEKNDTCLKRKNFLTISGNLAVCRMKCWKVRNFYTISSQSYVLISRQVKRILIQILSH